MEIRAQAEHGSGIGLKLIGIITESVFTSIRESRSRSPGFPTNSKTKAMTEGTQYP
jgi:hypothetical protein